MKIDKQLLSTFRRQFSQGCMDFGLIDEGDRILIALSGGKDSLVLTWMLAQRAQLHKPRITVEAAHVVMDNIPYETERGYLEQFCEQTGVRLHVLHSSFDESTDKRKTKCYLCAHYRRKTLFEFAEANGFNKIALGHHQDDIITTLLMNMTYEGRIDTMMPKVIMRHYPTTIIRPMCRVRESVIQEIANTMQLKKMKAVCPYDHETKRKVMADVFHNLEEINPEARYNLWHSMFADRLK